MRIEEKWGFGMAPPFPHVQAERLEASKAVLSLLVGEIDMQAVAAQEAKISLFKGLVSRSWKQDQWDWFTVWSQLGRPSRRRLMAFTDALYAWRRAALAGNREMFLSAMQTLFEARLQRTIGIFLGEIQPWRPDGQIYILSTREMPSFLKIGFTNRTVEERVKEINSSTGVIIPFGVRAAWNVMNAPEIERRIHALFSKYRVRADREFFQMDYLEANAAIFSLINECKIESEDPMG
jgi:hypothetical protein